MPMSTPRFQQHAWVALLAGLHLACASPHPNRVPLGEPFPETRGQSLALEQTTLPTAHRGTPALYLVGYVQDTQFDLDRWAVGLLQAGFPWPIVEVPTIPGLAVSIFGEQIDEGMRSGIPREDWSSVVTLYGRAAEPVAAFTGTEQPRNGRVLLLDADGRVQWFWDQGFSARRLLELSERARQLTPSRRKPPAPG